MKRSVKDSDDDKGDIELTAEFGFLKGVDECFSWVGHVDLVLLVLGDVGRVGV